jgi:hypothetical protein
MDHLTQSQRELIKKEAEEERIRYEKHTLISLGIRRMNDTELANELRNTSPIYPITETMLIKEALARLLNHLPI